MANVAPIPNQSYLVKQMQFRIAALLAHGLMRDLGSNITGKSSKEVYDNPGLILYYPSSWRIDDQTFSARRSEASAEPIASIKFSNSRWDGQNSNLNYGDKVVDQNIIEADDEKSKIIRNDTDQEIHIAYEESVDLTNSFSSSITKGVTLDMEKNLEIGSEQKVSGSYAGVSAEVSLSEKFGISESKSTSTEEGKEKSQEGTKSEKLSIDFPAAARQYYLLEITKEHASTQQPFNIDGVMDFDIEMEMNHLKHMPNTAKYRPTNNIYVTSIDGLMQLVYGYDTKYSKMNGYFSNASEEAKASLNWIQDIKNRHIQVSGIKHASLESNANYHISQLGQNIPDKMTHLPVVNANDV